LFNENKYENEKKVNEKFSDNFMTRFNKSLFNENKYEKKVNEKQKISESKDPVKPIEKEFYDKIESTSTGRKWRAN